MKVSATGRKAIAGHEGVRLEAYPDPATGGEPWTVGVGHTSAAGPPKVVKGMTITADECDQILARDLATFEAAVSNAVTVPLNPNQFDALVSLAFNIGAGNFGKSTLLRQLNAGNYRSAAEQFTAWNKAAGKVMPGLIIRRAAERALFLRPVPANTPDAVPVEQLPTKPASPPPATITSDEPIPKGFWARFVAAFRKRTSA